MTPSLVRPIPAQVERLVELGVPELARMSADRFRDLASGALVSPPGSVVVVHPDLVPASALAPLLARAGKRGFVVSDMVDLDDFAGIDGVDFPTGELYVIAGVERGDEFANVTPDEALPVILDRGRRPLTVSEGISWLLQFPGLLEPNKCFMTIGSRKRKDGGRGVDSRVPAVWISGGIGRDGAANRGAPKVGWCWAGNRHTWLGIASTSTFAPVGDFSPRRHSRL